MPRFLFCLKTKSLDFLFFYETVIGDLRNFEAVTSLTLHFRVFNAAIYFAFKKPEQKQIILLIIFIADKN